MCVQRDLLSGLKATDFGFAVNNFSDFAEGFYFVNQARVHGISAQRTTNLREDVGQRGGGGFDF